jgi:hypothetical protein
MLAHQKYLTLTSKVRWYSAQLITEGFHKHDAATFIAHRCDRNPDYCDTDFNLLFA